MTRLILVFAVLIALDGVARAAEEVRVGFAHVDITPKLDGKLPVFLAGYGQNRQATGVHDPLFARGLVLSIGGKKLALVSVDLIGLQYPAVRRIREGLKDYAYVMVASTHNHEGPDVIGIWGPHPLRSGVDNAYVDFVVAQSIKMVRAAEAKLAPAAASYGTAEDELLLGDSRKPKVYDGVLRVVRFDGADKKPAGILVQWNCHPEAMGRANTLLTADFPWATIAALEKRYKCPIAYFSGAVGGLMAPPDHVVKNERGEELKEGDFEYARVYGEMVAKLGEKAIDGATPVDLGSLAVSAKPITIPLQNSLYKVARAAGVLRREGRKWTGDMEELGPMLTPPTGDTPLAVETEVAYLRLGELHVACIPGELYPELVYGKYQQPVEAGADFPDAPLEKPVMQSLPGKKTLLFGLANDEVGYIIPKRQWDRVPPFCYGRTKSQYGEINSCGPEVAPILMKALERRVAEAAGR